MLRTVIAMALMTTSLTLAPPLAAADADAGSAPAAAVEGGPGPNDLLVHLAQYGTGCGVSVLQILLCASYVGAPVGMTACPAVNGIAISYVGDTLRGRPFKFDIRLVPQVVATYLGTWCLLPACGMAGILGGFTAMALGMFSTAALPAELRQIPLLGGVAAYLLFVLGGYPCGLVLLPLLPTLAYHLFSEQEPAKPAAAAPPPLPAPPPASQPATLPDPAASMQAY